jgi:hypothetical protein
MGDFVEIGNWWNSWKFAPRHKARNKDAKDQDPKKAQP